MRQFVPMTDEMLNSLDSLPGPLVPYHCGVPCLHAMRGADKPAANQPPPPSAADGERIAGLDANLFGRAGV